MKQFVKIITVTALVFSAFTAFAGECSSKKAQQAANKTDIIDTAVAAGSFNTLAAAIKAAGLVDTLKSDGPFTVFAPTDEAFAKLPPGTVETLLKPENKDKLVSILTYHVVSGKVPASKVTSLNSAATVNGQRVSINTKKGVMVDKANVVKTDIETSNGIIHVIDTVLLPEEQSLVGVAQSAGKFNTLIAAVKAAGLADVLGGDGPFTVFAPTDEAFDKLPKGTISDLLKPENREKLTSILKYHVVSGRVYSSDASGASHVSTLQGGKLDVNSGHGNLKINDAGVVAADIQAGNGVIHVIDTVLLPR